MGNVTFFFRPETNHLLKPPFSKETVVP